jgi:hypothetical protein
LLVGLLFRSLPSTPLCTGTQINLTLFCSAGSRNSWKHFQTNLDLIRNEFKALRAAWLSLNMKISLLYLARVLL